MAKSEYVLPKPDTVSMSITAAERLIASGNGDAALLYIYILKNNGHFSYEEAEQEISLSTALPEAMTELVRLGLVSPPAMPYNVSKQSQPQRNERQSIQQAVQPAREARNKAANTLERRDAPPEYSVSDIKRRIEEGSDFKAVVTEVQQRLGRVLSGGDLTILYGIYDYLGLPAEVIMLLTGWCIEEQERKNGEGKKPTLRMIEKEAYIWAHKELFSLEAAEEYLKKKSQSKKKSEEIKGCLGIKGRPLSPTEEKFITSWIEMGFDSDAIEEAYDRTILNKKELIWPYINKIIESWHKNGLHKLSEIREGDKKAETRAEKREAEDKPKAADYERMRKYVEKYSRGDDSES
ncbi:MAG: DnaD domain protein [Papillibacter sp.]|nr:DnaD domain protein [Papillibacter sp.]